MRRRDTSSAAAAIAAATAAAAATGLPIDQLPMIIAAFFDNTR